MIDLASVVFVVLLHLSYLGFGLYWSDAQKRFFENENVAKKLSFCESVFKHWVVGIFFAILFLYLASFLKLYWAVFGLITLVGLGNLMRHFIRSRFFPELFNSCKMQQGRTAAGRSRYLRNLPLVLIILIACAFVFIVNGNLSVNSQVHCVSGMGNWALKSKIIFLESGLHASYFEHATHYGKFSYPPGFPLINAPLFILNGSEQDVILKLNSTLIFTSLFVFLSSLFMIHWKWYCLPPIVILLGFFLGDAAWSVSYWFYSEPLLILCCAVSTMLFIRGDMKSALLAASGASMIKQEGVLFLLLIGAIIIACLFFSKERKQKLILTSLVFMPYLSWKIITSFYGIHDSDFDFSMTNFKPEHLTLAYESIIKCGITKWEGYAGSFVIFPVLLLYSLWVRNWKILSVLSIALLLIASYMVAISFSSIEDIEWHLSATTRYLMLPAVIIFVALSFLFSKDDIKYTETNVQ